MNTRRNTVSLRKTSLRDVFPMVSACEGYIATTMFLLAVACASTTAVAASAAADARAAAGESRMHAEAAENGRDAANTSPPHIIWVVADDLGFDDVPFTANGARVKTPTLSALAASKGGAVLRNYYVNHICTPTRSSFMTGRYPIHLGLQHMVIRDAVPDAVPINETLVPEVLARAGYTSHAVGKWHLGFYQQRFTPTSRGFASHYGYYTGNEEYYNHTSPCWDCGNYTALDFHRETAAREHNTPPKFEPIADRADEYSTLLFAEEAVRLIDAHAATKGADAPLFLYLPFEAVHGAASCYGGAGDPPNCNRPDGDMLQAPPPEFVAAQGHIPAGDRRTFAGMVGCLDAAVANITAALAKHGMLDNSVLAWTTDNGAPSPKNTYMSNWPLRGSKATLWEGGVRGAAFFWDGRRNSSSSRSSADGDSNGDEGPRDCVQLMHASDWLPTFAALAGAPVRPGQTQPLDGVDQSAVLLGASPGCLAASDPRAAAARRAPGDARRAPWPFTYAPRPEILHNIDPIQNTSGIRVGDYKYLVGMPAAAWGPNPAAPREEAQPQGPAKQPASPGGDPAGKRPGKREYLYDVRLDESERTNLVGDPAHAATLAKLRARLAEHRATMVPYQNGQPDPAAFPKPGTDGFSTTLCTPSPEGPILCEPLGIWRPWRDDE